jgi:hypothetical protein
MPTVAVIALSLLLETDSIVSGLLAQFQTAIPRLAATITAAETLAIVVGVPDDGI